MYSFFLTVLGGKDCRKLSLGEASSNALYSAVESDYTSRHERTRRRRITKRQLGIGLAVTGVLGFLAILSIDLIDVGRQGGIGPAQSLALLLMAALTLVGISLIPLGDAPA